MDVDRRQVVRAAGAGLVALAIPGWFTACGPREPGGIRQMAAETVAKGQALLVLHVEDDEARSDDLGMLVGTFLVHAGDEAVAPLATCVLTCATTQELEELAPDLAVRKDVRAVVVLPGRPPVAAVTGDPPRLAWNDGEHESSVRARHAWLADQLDAVLTQDVAALADRAAAECAVVGHPPQNGQARIDLARGWPCTARLRAEQEPERRATWIATLANSVRERWHRKSPAGSTWAQSWGCGVTLDEPREASTHGVLCGMGFTPEISQRFLHFYTKAEREG